MKHFLRTSCWLLALIVVGSLSFSTTALFAKPKAVTKAKPKPAKPKSKVIAKAKVSKDEWKQLNFFEDKIRPVLVKHCYECHSAKADNMDSDYSVDTRMGIRAAGSSGKKAIELGDPNGSQLIKALKHQGDLEMPPEKKLPKSVIADFEKWIKMGAPDSRNGDPTKIRKKLDIKKMQELWSLKKVTPQKQTLAKFSHTKTSPLKQKQWARTPVDKFLLAKMEANQLSPVKDANPRSLIRRVYFDLTGLPPSPAEVNAFAKKPTQKEFEKVVDRLLASPRFGERWGRHWLDLARYAESSGMEFNFTYPHAWPYRDYVIASFNKDKPYDQFIKEQLAGDLLPAKNQKQREEQHIATGFLAIGTKRHNASNTEFRMDLIDDQIRATSEAFLGLTVGCARCHDHKFDPISTKDYYSLASIFRSTKTLYGTKVIKYSRHPSELIPFGKDAKKLHENYKKHEAKIIAINKEILKLDRKVVQFQKKEKKNKKNIADTRKQIKSLHKKIKTLRKSGPPQPKYAMGVTEGKPIDLRVAIGGDPATKGKPAPRAVPSTVSLKNHITIKGKMSGRLELAQWIVDPKNPLTSRVMVNRIWQHLFGQGIVGTPNNFGELGTRPSHPELLDYLAMQYVEQGWSTKKMIRSLVLSRAYQLSTRPTDANQSIDPNNVYLWRATPRRLEAEMIRDALFAVSGELDLTPVKGSEITTLGQQLARNVSLEKLNPKSKHRSVYLPVVRSYSSPLLQEFDFASSNLIVGKRSHATTAKQALFFLNNPLILEQSAATARLITKRKPQKPAAQIRMVYMRALSRPPSANEMKIGVRYLKTAQTQLAKKQKDAKKREEIALASFVQMVFGSAEFRYLAEPQTPPIKVAPKTTTKAKTVALKRSKESR